MLAVLTIVVGALYAMKPTDQLLAFGAAILVRYPLGGMVIGAPPGIMGIWALVTDWVCASRAVLTLGQSAAFQTFRMYTNPFCRMVVWTNVSSQLYWVTSHTFLSSTSRALPASAYRLAAVAFSLVGQECKIMRMLAWVWDCVMEGRVDPSWFENPMRRSDEAIEIQLDVS